MGTYLTNPDQVSRGQQAEDAAEDEGEAAGEEAAQFHTTTINSILYLYIIVWTVRS